MELGFFAMPAHPPERGIRAGFEWDLQVIRWLDELGFKEAWIGEHHTVPWEPNPAPDILIAQAFRETKNIRLGPGGFLLPFHHPAELASRICLLDHISGGRFNFGVAASSIPTDWEMFDVDGRAGQTREMTRESLDIILRLWTEKEPWTHKGKFWTVTKPDKQLGIFWPHLYPVQRPHPPIAMTGLSPGSDTLKQCGERGFIPMSLSLNIAYLKTHWDAVLAGAAKSGRKPDRKNWRVSREIFVADTDAEALKLAVDGAMGQFWNGYDVKIRKAFGALGFSKLDAQTPDGDITAEYMAKNNWIVGSPSTVAEKIERMHEASGGFGMLMIQGYDYADNPGAWRHSLELLAKDVLPRIRHL